jgi:hypothetical protein
MTAFTIPSAAAYEQPAATGVAGPVDPAAVCPTVLLPPDPPPRA